MTLCHCPSFPKARTSTLVLLTKEKWGAARLLLPYTSFMAECRKPSRRFILQESQTKRGLSTHWNIGPWNSRPRNITRRLPKVCRMVFFFYTKISYGLLDVCSACEKVPFSLTLVENSMTPFAKLRFSRNGRITPHGKVHLLGHRFSCE